MNDNFLKNLKQAFTETAEVVTKKTEDVVEIQKLRSKIYNAKKNVEVDYKKLGTIIYQRYLSGEAMDEELADVCEAIRDLMEQTEKYKDELAEKKGLAICDACDASNPKDALFCMKCGAKLPVRESDIKACPEECFEEDDYVEDSIVESSKEAAEEVLTEVVTEVVADELAAEDIVDVPAEE